jgi:hypothetical protein
VCSCCNTNCGVLVGSPAVIACAPSRNKDDDLQNSPEDEAPSKALLDRVAGILRVHQQKLEDAFAQSSG